MLKRWQFWVGAGISALFLVIALRNLRLGQVWDTMRTAQYVWILPGVAVYFFGVWARICWVGDFLFIPLVILVGHLTRLLPLWW